MGPLFAKGLHMRRQLHPAAIVTASFVVLTGFPDCDYPDFTSECSDLDISVVAGAGAGAGLDCRFKHPELLGFDPTSDDFDPGNAFWIETGEKVLEIADLEALEAAGLRFKILIHQPVFEDGYLKEAGSGELVVTAAPDTPPGDYEVSFVLRIGGFDTDPAVTLNLRVEPRAAGQVTLTLEGPVDNGVTPIIDDVPAVCISSPCHIDAPVGAALELSYDGHVDDKCFWNCEGFDREGCQYSMDLDTDTTCELKLTAQVELAIVGPGSISAPTDCADNVCRRFQQEILQLEAMPDNGASFVGWRDGCRGMDQSKISLTVEHNAKCTAVFEEVQTPSPKLTVEVNGEGRDMVDVRVGAETCPSDVCEFDVAGMQDPVPVELVNQQGEIQSVEWGGACTSNGDQMRANASIAGNGATLCTVTVLASTRDCSVSQPPVPAINVAGGTLADTGSDWIITARPLQSVQLFAGPSEVAPGRTISFQWTVDGQASGTFSQLNVMVPRSGALPIELTVLDDCGESTTQSIELRAQ